MLLFIEKLVNSFRRHLGGVYYRAVLKQVGRKCVFGRGLRIYGKQYVSVGTQTVLNDGVTIQSCEGATVTIGSRVVLSYDCMILTGGLDRDVGSDSMGHVARPVTVDDGAWLGARCLVMPGVTIGKNSLVAAGAVVTRSIPDNSLAAGVPAKVIRSLA